MIFLCLYQMLTMEILSCFFVRKLSVYCLVSILGFVASTPLQPAQAQIQPDDTLGTMPSILRNEAITGQLLIEGGAPRGSTLFHSFSDFNIAAADNAYFVNPDGIDVIVSRVTGNRTSNLLGTLGVLGDADLFFLNPMVLFLPRIQSGYGWIHCG